MRMFFAGLLIAAGGISASGIAQATEEGAALDALRTLSIQTYEASREIDEARRNSLARTSTVLDSRAADLRKQVDAFAKAHRIGNADASVLARKLRSVSMLVGNLERARALGASTVTHALVPEHKPANARSTFTRLDAQHGGRCEAALGLGAGHELDGVLETGADVWLHMEASAARAIKVDTAVSPLDTEIAVFDACPVRGEAPLSTSDDAFGLAAAAVLEPSAQRKAYWLRVRNLGARGEVDIVADETGKISGTVDWTPFTAGNRFAQVSAFSADGYYVDSTYLSRPGSYVLNLSPGSFYVVASAIANVGQVWPNIECGASYPGDCAHAPGQLVAVTAPGIATGIDFALNVGAHISGRVQDAVTGLPVASAQVTVNGTMTSYGAWSDSVGRFSVTALAAGSYHVSAQSARYLPQAFSNVDCPAGKACAPDAGNTINLVRQGAFEHADFSLHAAAFAQVVVQASELNLSTSVSAYDDSGTEIASAYGNTGQPFEVGPLSPGSYRFRAEAAGQVSQWYDHVDCVYDCQTKFAEATSVSVSTVSSSPSIGFDLNALAAIHGRVTDQASGEGLAATTLELWPLTPNWPAAFSTWTATDGTYSFHGLYPGSYWLVAASGDHRDVAYPNAPCDDQVPGNISFCETASAQAIVVGATDVGGIDFALSKNGGISGRISYAGPGSAMPVQGALATLYDASGYPVRNVYSDDLGDFSFADLPGGSYFSQVTGDSLFTQTFSGIDCPTAGGSCDPTTGTSIALAQGEQRFDIDFSVVDAHRFAGRIVDAISGAGVPGAIVDTWNPTDGQHCNDASTDAQGYYSLVDSGTCAAAASRAISTDAGVGYVDQVFADIACPHGSAYSGACSLDGATAVDFPTSPIPVQVNFSLARRDPNLVFADGFDSPTRARAVRVRR